MVLQAASGGGMCLRIEDNGIGMSAEQRKGSLGLRLVNMAARQIEGVATVEARTKGTGTVVTVDFPDPDNSGDRTVRRCGASRLGHPLQAGGIGATGGHPASSNRVAGSGEIAIGGLTAVRQRRAFRDVTDWARQAWPDESPWASGL